MLQHKGSTQILPSRVGLKKEGRVIPGLEIVRFGIAFLVGEP